MPYSCTPKINFINRGVLICYLQNLNIFRNFVPDFHEIQQNLSDTSTKMNVTFEKNGEISGVITVNVAEADYEGKVTEKLKEIGKKHTIPGFRKGHISLPELRKRFGREVKSDALNDVVFDATMNYLQENKIRVLGQPMPAEEKKEIDLKQSEYTFKYDVALWPEININLDKSVTLPFYKIEASEEMIAEQDKALCERYGAQVPGEEVDAKAVIKGSIMELNEDGTIKESEDAIQVTSGIVAPFVFKNKGETDKFMGKHVGDKVVFNPAKASDNNVGEMSSLLNIDKEKASEVKANFEFTIAEIIVVKAAEHNQDLYDDVFGKDKVHNEAEYKAAIKSMIEAQLAPNCFEFSNHEIHDYLLNTYGNSIKFDNALLKRWLLLTDRNLTEESVEKDFDGMLPNFKWEIISDAISEKLNVEVKEEDLVARANMYARQQMQQYGMYNMDEDTVADMGKRLLADKKIRRQIENELEDLILFNAVRNAVTIEEKIVSLDEFKKIISGKNEE